MANTRNIVGFLLESGKSLPKSIKEEGILFSKYVFKKSKSVLKKSKSIKPRLDQDVMRSIVYSYALLAGDIFVKEKTKEMDNFENMAWLLLNTFILSAALRHFDKATNINARSDNKTNKEKIETKHAYNSGYLSAAYHLITAPWSWKNCIPVLASTYFSIIIDMIFFYEANCIYRDYKQFKIKQNKQPTLQKKAIANPDFQKMMLLGNKQKNVKTITQGKIHERTHNPLKFR